MAQAQKKKTKITIKRADKWENKERFGKNVQRLIGNVIAVQDSTTFMADSAFLNTKSQDLDAYNNIHIVVNDTVHLYGDSLFYNGNQRIAHLYGDVRLTDPTTTLTTDYLIYNRNNQVASYTNGGKIINKENVLTSIIGDYYPNSKVMLFKDSVVLTNPKYVMNSDTLKYNTASEVVTFTGPTTVKGKNNFIFAESGWYDTKTDLSILSKNAYVINDENTLKGDSIFYDANKGLGQVYDAVRIEDTVNNLIIKGKFADYQKLLGYAYVTDSALAISVDRGDTLYMHADSLYTFFDKDKKVKQMKAFPKVRFFRKDFQGQCDSLVYSYADSCISFYKSPILWTGKNQMTSPDSIKLVTSNGVLDSLMIYNNAFIVSQDSTESFNQIKGKNMTGYFFDNDLRKIKVIGNAQTIYFPKEEGRAASNVNKTSSSDMLIRLQDNKLRSITYENKPDGNVYPVTDLPISEWFLKDFIWYGNLRPKNRHDVYPRKAKSYTADDIKAINGSSEDEDKEIPDKKPEEANQDRLVPKKENQEIDIKESSFEQE
ncbi:MAG: OstA-like protein [Bacteroidales bacterium]